MRLRRRFVATAIGVLIALAAGATFALGWLRSPIRIAERAIGTNLPHGLDRIAHDEKWATFGGSGFSVSVYRLPRDVGADLAARCESLGMQRGKLIDQPHRFTLPERYVDPEIESCYIVESSGMSAKLIAVSGEKLVIYVQH